MEGEEGGAAEAGRKGIYLKRGGGREGGREG